MSRFGPAFRELRHAPSSEALSWAAPDHRAADDDLRSADRTRASGDDRFTTLYQDGQGALGGLQQTFGRLQQGSRGLSPTRHSFSRGDPRPLVHLLSGERGESTYWGHDDPGVPSLRGSREKLREGQVAAVGRFADRATAAAARSLTWRGRMGAGRCGKLERPNPKSGISHGQIGSPGMASPWTVLDNLVALEIAGAAVASAWIFTEAWIYLGLLRPNLECDLGFHESTATLPSSGLRGYISAVAVVSVSEDGRFARAGIPRVTCYRMSHIPVCSRSCIAIAAGWSNWRSWTAEPGLHFMSDRGGSFASTCRRDARDADTGSSSLARTGGAERWERSGTCHPETRPR